MKLFLTSSGLSNENTPEFLRLLGKDPHGLRVAFIATAANAEPGLREKYMPEDIKDLAELGLEVEIINLENLTEPETVSAFDLFDVIYVYGGNTFHLMNEANRSGFREHILEIIKNKLYVGVSAGSIIATPNISNAGWEPADPNTCGLVDMRGLNLVPFLVCPHWNGEPRKEAIGSALEIKYLRDGEALAINN